MPAWTSDRAISGGCMASRSERLFARLGLGPKRPGPGHPLLGTAPTGRKCRRLARCSGARKLRARGCGGESMSRGTLDGTELSIFARSTCCCPVAMPKSSGGTRDSPKRWLNLGRWAARQPDHRIPGWPSSVAPPGAMNLTASRSLMEAICAGGRWSCPRGRVYRPRRGLEFTGVGERGALRCGREIRNDQHRPRC